MDIKAKDAEKLAKPDWTGASVLGWRVTDAGEVVLRVADRARNERRVLFGTINPTRKVTLTSGGVTSVCYLLDD